MGTKSKKKAKTRLDAYYRLAKDQGYRARSAFKLIQLNRKYDFLAKSKVLVDLCAAPGGWCQVAAKHMPIGSKIVGVDLVPIAPIRGCKTFVGDITDDKTRKMVVTWLKKEPVDCVIHDGAPNVGGVWSRDLFDQNALVLCAAKMATQLLRPGGWFVTKVFRSQDFQKLMWVMKQLFDKVEATKPLASRMESAEIFVVCGGYKAPKHVDPKMFHAQSVFADVGEEKIVSASGVLITPKNNVPQGYEEFATITHNVGTLSDFLHCRDPKEFLKSHHEIRFPEEDRDMLKSKHSRKELVYLCHDLIQVGEADRRRLIRWREQLIREQQRATREESEDDDGAATSDVAGAAGSDEEGDHLLGDGEDDITNMARQLIEIRKREAKELKKKQKKIVDRKLKQVKGLINYDPTASADHLTDVAGFDHKGGAAAMEGGEIDLDALPEEDADGGNNDWTIANVGAIDEERISKLMDKHFEDPESERHLNDPLAPVMGATLGDEDDIDLGSDDAAGSDAEDDDDDNKPIRAVAMGQSLQLIEGREEAFDVDYYGNYIPAERSNRVRVYEEGFGGDDEEGDEEDDGLSPQEKKNAARKVKDEAELDEAGKQSKWQRRHLNIDKVLKRTFPKPRDPKKRNRRLEEDQVELQNVGDADAAVAVGGKRGGMEKGKMKFRDQDASDDDDDSDDDYVASDLSSLAGNASDGDDFEVRQGRQDSRRKKAVIPDIGKLTAMELVKQQRKQTTKDNKQLRKDNKKKTKNSGKQKDKKDDTTFEEIPIALTDPDIRARTHAIAVKMLDKRSRRDMLEASINKYMNNDDEELPDWFVKDEQRNCKVFLPVTAAEVEAERNKFRELNARPSKKVMEAMGRKRRKAQRMLRGLLEKGKSDPRARQKANGTSVRTLMRARVIKGPDNNKKKNKPLDPKSMGEKKRTRQRLKRSGVKTGGGGGKRR